MNKLLLPMFAPIILEIWNGFIFPEIQKLESQIGSEEIKLIATTFTDTLNKLVQSEVPKIQ